MGRRVLVSKSLRTAEAYQKLNLPRESAINPACRIKHYKRALRSLNDPILHSQNYKAIEYKQMFVSSEPKLYPLSYKKGVGVAPLRAPVLKRAKSI
jgi:hypothetical protein